MNCRPLLLLTAILFATGSRSQAPAYAQKFSADTVIHTIKAITKELSLKHPGFYRYNSIPDFHKYIDSVTATITDSLTRLETFVKMKSIISRINCLHTGIALSAEHKQLLDGEPNLFPFQLYCTGDKAFVINNYSGNALVQPGNEITAINGKSMGAIIQQLLPLIPADGYNLTMRYKALYHFFPLWYRYIGLADSFTFTVKQNGIEKTYQTPAVKFNDIAREGFLKEPVLPKQLDLKIKNGIAFLTIHTFARSVIKKGDQQFKTFIDDVFSEIKRNNIQQLVVDLRNNTGGSDGFAAYFASYFFNQPFRYWDRIEVTEAVAREIKGPLVKAFYRKPVQKDSLWLWQKARTARDFDFYEVQKPAKNNYTGKTYILINGFCMSSCADVAAILSHNRKAVFIGQETGGGYQGNNSGMMPEEKIMPFGFTLTVPLQKYINAVDPVMNIGRGTIPGHIINLTAQDVINGTYREMEFVIRLIHSGIN